ncbi:hypothetical protein HPB48_011858 [Haemaphysalis longicornis]|uniref:Uncharacterized protein n=1 Tax=Haemaphysalis longicornis TaxID=44386 RepID=A0A9J6FA86_HAELO|nr:hypothetical protein HPB48_011858 [Haemaphysalis longicornis]
MVTRNPVGSEDTPANGSRMAAPAYVCAGLAYSTACLLSTVLFLLLVTHLNKWRMNRVYGAILMAWYLAFMVVACLYELNVLGYVNPPSCDSDY